MPTRRPRSPVDWNRELAREHVLQMRHERWRSNSIHVLKVVKTIAVAWLLLRHGADIADVVITVTGTNPTPGR